MPDTEDETAAYRLRGSPESTCVATRSIGIACRTMLSLALAGPMLFAAGNASAQSIQNSNGVADSANRQLADGTSTGPGADQQSRENSGYRGLDERTSDEGGSDWSGFVGLGALIRPLYDGSSETVVNPVPLLHVTWRNRIELGPEGLSVLFSNTPSLRLGAGLTFDPGRDEQDGRSLISNGDAEKFLRGMGDVKARPGLRAFASSRVGPVMLQASVAKFFADDDPLVPQNDGVLGEIGATMPLFRGDRLRVAARVNATIVDDSYMRAFFGVTPTQSARSGYAIYTPDGGFKDITFGLHAEWNLSRHLFLAGDAGATRLLGDAEDSPLVRDKTGPLVLVGLGYRF